MEYSCEGWRMKIDFGVVVDTLPGLVWTTQSDGRSAYANRSWREYTGLGPDESKDHGWQAAIHPEDLATLLETWEQIRQTGSAKEIYVRVRRYDAEYRWFTLRPSLSSATTSVGAGSEWMPTRGPSPMDACVDSSTCCRSRPHS